MVCVRSPVETLPSFALCFLIRCVLLNPAVVIQDTELLSAVLISQCFKLRMRPPLVIAVEISLSIAHDLCIGPFACSQFKLYTALSRDCRRQHSLATFPHSYPPKCHQCRSLHGSIDRALVYYTIEAVNRIPRRIAYPTQLVRRAYCRTCGLERRSTTGSSRTTKKAYSFDSQ